MRDFTLIIPTYNRPKQLGALLAYLNAQQLESRVLILDSSQPQPRAANRKMIRSAGLDLEYAEFPAQTHPFDKFREGVHKVGTEFCALCADDDLILLDGVKDCLEALRSDPQASVAQGYSFSFQCQPSGNIDLGNILYFSSTISDATPLGRLARLFASYQAATYGNYRTSVLRQIFDTLRPVKSILARELLGSAMAAIEGHMIRVPCFSHGRSMGASENYQNWHPLEWFATDPGGLFNDYGHYRQILADAVLNRPDNDRDAAEVRRVLDLIHLRYLSKHAPDSALAFIIESKICRIPFEQYWPQAEIHEPLDEAARIGLAVPAWSRKGAVQRIRLNSSRSYDLYPTFSVALGSLPTGPNSITHLLHSLESYRWRPPAPAPAPGGTRVRGSATVSVLLCNYNDARYLPDSLDAICSQTRLPEEVIVLDDGSTDNSLEIIEGFARRFPFIRVVKNKINRGLLYSINRALNEARCDFIVWAAADDRLMPNFVERNVSYLRRFPAAGMAFSRLAVFKDGSDEITAFTEKNHGVAFDFGTAAHFLSPLSLQERLQQSHLWISANTVMASREAVIRAGGFDQELRWHADYFAFLAVALRHGACCIPETLAAMRQREQTYSSTGMANRDEQRATLGRLADKLTLKGWRDVGIAVLGCPSVLSPFGAPMLEALLLKPRRWPFAVTYGLWWTTHQLGQRSGTLAAVGTRLSRTALRGLSITLRAANKRILRAKRT